LMRYIPDRVRMGCSKALMLWWLAGVLLVCVGLPVALLAWLLIFR
jgi:hypothetical protein